MSNFVGAEIQKASVEKEGYCNFCCRRDITWIWQIKSTDPDKRLTVNICNPCVSNCFPFHQHLTFPKPNTDEITPFAKKETNKTIGEDYAPISKKTIDPGKYSPKERKRTRRN